MATAGLTEVARYRVLFDDCDPMRIMYYGSYYRLFEIGWTELFRQLGQPLTVQLARGLYVSVIEVGCRYVRPARYDDELVIKAGLTEVGPTGFTIHYEITALGGDVLASGHTLHAVRDAANRPQPLPPELQHLPVTRGRSEPEGA